jgi:hypothetical protein
MKAGTLIVSLDPGGTTGVASYSLPNKNGERRSDSYNIIDGMELGPEPHHKELWTYLTNADPDLILYEGFVQVDSAASVLISIEYIAIAKLYAELTRKTIIMRPRSNKDVAWLKTAALKKMNAYVPGKPHRNDATRHLIHYIVSDLKRKEVLEGLRT